MPLFLKTENGEMKKFEENFNSLSDTYPHLVLKAKQFHSCSRRKITSAGLLYIRQREMGVVSHSDPKILVMGSEDATTCHIVIICHSSGTVSLAHLDGVKTDTAIKQMIKEMKSLNDNSESGYSVHIFGGFQDDRQLSIDLSMEIIESLQGCDEEIILQDACMTHMNNCVRNGVPFPVIYGVAIDIQSREIFPAEFPNKGPDVSLRACRHGSDVPVLSIYNSSNGEIVIPPFDYEPFPYGEKWLQAPAHFILQHLSTSPQQEPLDFVDNMKQTIQFSMTTPKESVFVNGQPRVHKLGANGEWILK